MLVVDDSKFICKRIQEILEEDSTFKVVGVAYNGVEAIELVSKLRPHVITMDVEMPIMDGITAVKKIMTSCPCPILMFSAMTQIGAKATFEALNAGAIDFLPKRLEDIDSNREIAKSLLRNRIREVALQTQRMASVAISPRSTFFKPQVSQDSNKAFDLVVIAASTGGPVAIQHVLRPISENCKLPVLVLQHMPDKFTKIFAERLNQQCKIKVKEAEDGDVLQAGTALLAPGGLQMEIRKIAGRYTISLRKKQVGEVYGPCIDITFTSLAKEFSGHILAIVLTGMGSDGKEGAVILKQYGAEVWAQDEASSTIYGMPRAIVEANIADKIYSLDEIANAVRKII